MMPGFDEMHSTSGSVREHYRGYDGWLSTQAGEVMAARREEAELIFRRVGITFAVYGAKDEDGTGTERLGHRNFKGPRQGPRRASDGLKCLDLAPVSSRRAVSAGPWVVHRGRWRSMPEG